MKKALYPGKIKETHTNKRRDTGPCKNTFTFLEKLYSNFSRITKRE